MIPYNFGVSLNFVYEDSIIALILPCIFLLIITHDKYKYIILSILFFILYFLKLQCFLWF